MPTVAELSGAYENFLLNPRLCPGICRRCFTFIDPAYTTCYPSWMWKKAPSSSARSKKRRSGTHRNGGPV